MRKWIVLLTLVLVIFIAINRQRLFPRDPLATLTRDGAKVSGVDVIINFSNDVVLRDGSAGKHRLYQVQN